MQLGWVIKKNTILHRGFSPVILAQKEELALAVNLSF